MAFVNGDIRVFTAEHLQIAESACSRQSLASDGQSLLDIRQFLQNLDNTVSGQS